MPNQKNLFKNRYLCELEEHGSAEIFLVTPSPYPKQLATHNLSINAGHLESNKSSSARTSLVKPKIQTEK